MSVEHRTRMTRTRATPGPHLAVPPAATYPLRFEPILKRLIWGGRRLGTLLGKPIGEGHDYAESWELADHRDDVSVVAAGPLAGRTLRELIAERPASLLGGAHAGRSQFPLLVKFLDAHRDLSVQVHPDDELGRQLVDDNGKTEAWVVVHAEPGSRIYAGLREGATRAAFAEALRRDAVEPLLHRIPARPGDCIFIPAGTVHAIGAGVVVAEVQQMSDATFRVYDWGRLGADGRPRTLHVEEALQAIDFEAGPVAPVRAEAEPIGGGTRERLVACPYFTLERLRLAGPASVGSAERFTILLGLGGEAEVRHGGEAHPLPFGRTLLLPAEAGACEVVPRGRSTTVLACTIEG
jgi:mannose-6-phosphate isomerase